jgi:hypothetical protein
MISLALASKSIDLRACQCAKNQWFCLPWQAKASIWEIANVRKINDFASPGNQKHRFESLPIYEKLMIFWALASKSIDLRAYQCTKINDFLRPGNKIIDLRACQCTKIDGFLLFWLARTMIWELTNVRTINDFACLGKQKHRFESSPM